MKNHFSLVPNLEVSEKILKTSNHEFVLVEIASGLASCNCRDYQIWMSNPGDFGDEELLLSLVLSPCNRSRNWKGCR